MKKKQWIKPKVASIKTKKYDVELASCSKNNAQTPRDCDYNRS